MSGIKGKGKCAAWVFAHVGHQGDECLIFPYNKLKDGYGLFSHLGKMWRAHVMMCELTYGPAPEGHEAAHNCGNGHLGCVNPKHLEWKTRSQNQRDRYVNERKSRKGKPRTRLTPEQVEEIRAKKGIETQQSLADRFGVSRTNIIMIQKGETWNEKSHQYLSDDAIRDIRAKRRGVSRADLAKKYNISLIRIGRIRARLSYAHVADHT